MKKSVRLLILICFCLLAFAVRSPAPLVYLPGEGWTYDTPGTDNGKWQRARAKDQLEVGQAAYDKKDYSLALKAARRVEKQWPLSDYTPKAEYLIGLCYEATGQDEKAFNAYQRIIDHNPKADNYQEILGRQYEIANRYLKGQWFKLWNYVPFFPSMDKTADMYQKIIKSGPYSDVAAEAQLKIGEAREKESETKDAIKAYETAADRYNDRPKIAADALYKSGMAYRHQFKSADYDKNLPTQSIAALTDFITLYPNDPRVPEAQKTITELKSEAARGSFSIAQFYEKNKKWNGALVYYNDVLVQDPTSPLVEPARRKIDELKQKIGGDTAPVAPKPAAPALETPATPAVEAPAEPAAAIPAADVAAPSAPPIAAVPPAEAPTKPEAALAPVPAAKKSGSGWWDNVRHFKWLPSRPHGHTNQFESLDTPPNAAGNGAETK